MADTTDTTNTDTNNTEATNTVVAGGTNQVISVNSNIIDIPLIGLIKRQTYNYSFVGTGGSAPAIIYPTGGIFTAASKEHVLTANVTFCRNSNLCKPGQDGVLPYENTGSEPYTSFVVRLEADGDISYSKVIHLSCESNCFQNISHAFQNEAGSEIRSITLDQNSKNRTQIISRFDNLLRDTSYYYKVDSERDTWPVTISPASGVFFANKENYNLVYDIEFDAAHVPAESIDVILSNITVHVSGVSANNDIGTYDTEPLTIRCNDCLPTEYITGNTSSQPDINGTYSLFDTNLSFNNLLHNTEYTYTIEVIDSNWPVDIFPVSGTADSANSHINILSAFCPNQFDCLDGYIQPTTSAMVKYSKFANLEISLYKDSSKIDSLRQSLTCVSCPKPPHVSGVSSITLGSGIGCDTFNVEMSGLYPAQKYKYRFESISSNWPTVINPYSGTFIASSQDYSLPFRLFFCASTGLCPNDMPGVLDYTINSSDYIFNVTCAKYSNFKFILEEDIPMSSQSLNSTEIASSITSVLCEDCLPDNSPSSTPLSSGNILVDNGNNIIVNPPSTTGNMT